MSERRHLVIFFECNNILLYSIFLEKKLRIQTNNFGNIESYILVSENMYYSAVMRPTSDPLPS